MKLTIPSVALSSLIYRNSSSAAGYRALIAFSPSSFVDHAAVSTTLTTNNFFDSSALRRSVNAITSSPEGGDVKSVARVTTGWTAYLLSNGTISVGILVFSTIVLALLPNIPLIPDDPIVPITSISTGLASIYFMITALTEPTS